MKAKLNNPNLCVTFGDRVEYLVAAAGGPSEFGRKMGMSPPALMRWRKQGAEPTLGNLIKLAEVGGVRLEWLATGALPAYPHEVVSPPQGASERPEQPAPVANPAIPEAMVVLDEEAARYMIEFAVMMSQGVNLTAKEGAAFGLRMMKAAMQTGKQGEEAAREAVTRYKLGGIPLLESDSAKNA